MISLQNQLNPKNNKNEYIYTIFLSIILAIAVIFFIKYLTGNKSSHAKLYFTK